MQTDNRATNLLIGEKYKLVFIINLIILVCAYSSMLFTHFSIDSYGMYYTTDKTQALISGRGIFYLFYLLCEITGFNPVKDQIFLIILFIILSTYVLTEIVQIFYTYIKDSLRLTKFWIIELIFLVSFINVFYIEWFLYPEVTLIYGLALLFLCFAIKTSLNQRGSKRVIFSSIFLFTALNCYQAIFPIYIILMIAVVVLNNKLKFTIQAL